MKRPAVTILAATSIAGFSLVLSAAIYGQAIDPAPVHSVNAPVKEMPQPTVTPSMTSIYLHGATAPIWVDARQVTLDSCGPDGDCTATWQGQQVWARKVDWTRARKAVSS